MDYYREYKDNVYCACGCGKELSHSKQFYYLIRGESHEEPHFYSRKHAAIYRERRRKELSYYKRKDVKEKIKRKKTYRNRKRECEMDKPIKFDGKMYCEHYDSEYYNCVNCMEQAIFKYKSCYKEAKK